MPGPLDEEQIRSAAVDAAGLSAPGSVAPPVNSAGFDMSRYEGVFPDEHPYGGIPAFSGGMPTPQFINANMRAPQQGWGAMDYTQEGWNPDEAGVANPGFFRDRNGALFTDNWQLLGRGPGWIMRADNLINAMTPNAKQSLPFGYDTSFSDTGESGTANYPRRASPGGAMTARNKYDAYYWPGGSILGYSRWPYQTDV